MAYRANNLGIINQLGINKLWNISDYSKSDTFVYKTLSIINFFYSFLKLYIVLPKKNRKTKNKKRKIKYRLKGKGRIFKKIKIVMPIIVGKTLLMSTPFNLLLNFNTFFNYKLLEFENRKKFYFKLFRILKGYIYIFNNNLTFKNNNIFNLMGKCFHKKIFFKQKKRLYFFRKKIRSKFIFPFYKYSYLKANRTLLQKKFNKVKLRWLKRTHMFSKYRKFNKVKFRYILKNIKKKFFKKRFIFNLRCLYEEFKHQFYIEYNLRKFSKNRYFPRIYMTFLSSYILQDPQLLTEAVALELSNLRKHHYFFSLLLKKLRLFSFDFLSKTSIPIPGLFFDRPRHYNNICQGFKLNLKGRLTLRGRRLRRKIKVYIKQGKMIWSNYKSRLSFGEKLSITRFGTVNVKLWYLSF